MILRTTVTMLAVLTALSTQAAAQDRTIDYRFKPPIWHTPLGLPGDWHKPLVNADGALIYDFGPGPYARAATFVSVALEADSIVALDQTVHDPRVPLVQTVAKYSGGSVTTEAFSAVPRYDWQAENERPYTGDVRRVNGTNSMIGWADPPGDVDPAFRNVAYGTNRPVEYRLGVEPGAARTAVLGFADPYRRVGHRVTRVMSVEVEGAPTQDIDVVDRAGRNSPALVIADARDVDGDGWLEINVKANPATVDGNVFLSAIWLFAQGADIDEGAVIRGELSDEAEVYVDCGRDQQLRERGPRTDVLRAVIDGAGVSPVVRVRTKRELSHDARHGALMTFSDPFIVTTPRATAADQMDDGWELSFAPGTSEITVAVLQPGGPGLPVPHVDVGAEKDRQASYWREESGIPFAKIQIPDSALRALFEGSIRTMYQLTEYVDGQLQSQPGPSVYRGLWASNQPRVGRALTHLGDFETARSSFRQAFRHQQADGRILILTPPTLLKETGISMHAVYQHARMTRDRDYLESYWPRLAAAAEWISSMRRVTTNPDALNYGLMPAGLSDGGVGGVVPEFTTNHWGLLALRNMADGARWLGRDDETARYQAEFAAYDAAFRRAASAALSQDEFGNWFLPVRMEFDAGKHVPQRAQTSFAYQVYPGRTFAKDDMLVRSNMKMLLDARTAEGLTLTTGWLDGGVQPFIEATRAGVWLYLGEVEKAQQILYAVANHASPTHVWVEEQLPGAGPRRSTGDVPHSSACSEFINAIRYMIALEDGDHLDLLKGVPTSWWYPGARLSATDIPTEFGALDFDVSVSADGHRVTLAIEPIGESGPGGPRIHLRSLKRNGFALVGGAELPDVWGGEWGRTIRLELFR